MRKLVPLINKLNIGVQTYNEYVIIENRPYSLKFLNLMFQEGLLLRLEMTDRKQKLKVFFKYTGDGTPAFKKIRLVSKPNKPLSFTYQNLVKLNRLSLLILSTVKGLCSSDMCLKKRIGGKVFCYFI